MCLSLLGTWSGPGWIPGTSTLLQVLLSIQSLIFVDKPFFNEPGYEPGDAANQRQSEQYDRQIRAATLKVAILLQMKNPSPLFRDVIIDHFRLKKLSLLEQLDRWEAIEKQQDVAQDNSNVITTPIVLVAGGGVRPSYKIVKGLCDEIRRWVEITYPSENQFADSP